MNRFYLNTNTKQVHQAGCIWLSHMKKSHRYYLGKFCSLESAVQKADFVLGKWAWQAGRLEFRPACACDFCM